MFKTAKNTIKKAAKDQVEFVGAILTGVFVGSIFTLAYIKYWDTSKVTFADIGGMLAGAGTIGLLALAFRARTVWMDQIKAQDKSESIKQYRNTHRELMSIIIKIAVFNNDTTKIQNTNEFDDNHQKLQYCFDSFQYDFLKLTTLYTTQKTHGLLTLKLAQDMTLFDKKRLEFKDVIEKRLEIIKIEEEFLRELFTTRT